MSARLSLLDVDVDGAAQAAFTTRIGGISDGPWSALNLSSECGDRDAAVRANRRRLAHHLAIEAAGITMVNQVHGATVIDVSASSHSGRFTEELRGWRSADAMICREANVPLLVLGADCPSILLWRRDGREVGAVHAGWRGLVEGVIENAVDALGDPGSLAAAIGPGIGPCCYRVSGDVRGLFQRRFGRSTVHARTVHLAAAARCALIAAGVPAAAVTTIDSCTSCDDERWFSYRASGGTCGRHAGIIWINDGRTPHA